MNTDEFKKSIQKATGQRNIFLMFSVAQMVTLIILASCVFLKKERIVVVPTAGPSYWIEDNKVSHVYLEKMGVYLSDILLNRSPSDVDKKNQLILEHVHPAFYHGIRKQLILEKESMLKSNQSYFFRAGRSYVAGEGTAFVIEGEFLVLVGKSGDTPICAQNEHKKFILNFQCQNGKLLLTSLKKDIAS